MVALQQEHEEATARLKNEYRISTQPTRLQLRKLQVRLQLEQAFISSIRKLPDEILVEIFNHSVCSVPTRQLALVCRGFRRLLLNTPRLWRKIEAYMVSSDMAEFSRRRLQRRIQLSRSTLLDVTLNFHAPFDSRAQNDCLFELVGDISTDRWQSVTLVAFRRLENGRNPLSGRLKGSFAALRQLSIEYGSGVQAFPSVIELLANSRPCIKDLYVRYHIPSALRNSPAFLQVRRLTARDEEVLQMPRLTSLQELHVLTENSWNNSETYNYEALPVLPSDVHFDSLDRQLLPTLKLENVTRLSIRTLRTEKSVEVVDLPNVSHLAVPKFSDLRLVNAPRLQTVELTLSLTKAARYRESSQVKAMVRDGTLLVRPTTFVARLSMTTEAILRVLQAWSQLEHVSLIWEEFSWKGNFASALTKRSNLICPNLVSLDLTSRYPGDFTSEVWRPVAERIFQTRKWQPLRSINWRTEEAGNWNTMTSSSK